MPGFIITGAEAGGIKPAEIARVHRWILTFDVIPGLNLAAFYALSCQRPSVEFDRATIHHKQNRMWLPGKYRWNPIVVKFYEVLDPDVFSTASEIFTYWSTKLINYKTNTLIKDFRTTVGISLEDGSGGSRHKYTLHNVWPSKVEPVELTYESSTLATVQVTLSYDSATEGEGEAESGGGDSGVSPGLELQRQANIAAGLPG